MVPIFKASRTPRPGPRPPGFAARCAGAEGDRRRSGGAAPGDGAEGGSSRRGLMAARFDRGLPPPLPPPRLAGVAGGRPGVPHQAQGPPQEELHPQQRAALGAGEGPGGREAAREPGLAGRGQPGGVRVTARPHRRRPRPPPRGAARPARRRPRTSPPAAAAGRGTARSVVTVAFGLR